MSSFDKFGLSASGLTTPRMADFQAVLAEQFRAAYGAGVNLDARTNMGQLINIMAERFSSLAELIEAVYAASYPAGAEGVAVDNLLALQGLKRLPAKATKTATAPVTSANGITKYGLVCYGTVGTVIPAGTLVADSATPPNTFATDSQITIGAAQNAVQTVSFLQNPTAGTFKLQLQTPSLVTYTTPAMPYSVAGRAVTLTWQGTPTDTYGQFVMSLSGLGTLPLLTAYSAVTDSNDGYLKGAALAGIINQKFNLSAVTGSGSTQTSIQLDFGNLTVPNIVCTGFAPVVTPSMQANINQLADASGNQPFLDVAAARTGNVFTLTFGGSQGASSPTAAKAIPQVVVTENLLTIGQTSVNVQVGNQSAGQPAQGVGSATCTQTGAVVVSAGQLNEIVTQVAGFDSVTNQLDCVTGQDAESDTAALARRASLVANQAQGPLAAILQRVQAVDGVSAAIAFANTGLASQQIVRVAKGSTSGSFVLYLAGNTLTFPYNVTAAAAQAAVRALPNFGPTKVLGDVQNGLVFDFGTSQGGQAIDLMSVGTNSTGVSVLVEFGRYPKSVEIVAQGGDDSAVAEAIFASAPAGIATYGAPVLITTVSMTAGSATVTAADVTGLVIGLGVIASGLPSGALITVISGSKLTLSAVALSTSSNVKATFAYAIPVSDTSGNAQVVQFSRPQTVRIYASVTVVSDMYATPGDASSGVNPRSQWSSGSIAQIQANIKAAVDAVGIGGLISATGSNGVANSCRDIAGIDDLTVYFGYSADTMNTGRLQLLAEQVPSLQLGDVIVSVS